ncbi:efflux RND transporter periplasmic adaptor subunit [Rugamonas apoptosis]|uniref:Efflux RND transporter periplasmic adaptor subunit n=5 Tax=Rugamonas apoptosis TaxID=2758570 RepID=A0A7W2ILB1_9BURK|nr:efflux RND transporter periplasmic adaptor subunit [Rugamonas apoptosis]MBA5688620.1 efflux RND transporter periplasmic adaptor subunit [Rugamonas apoptosis]
MSTQVSFKRAAAALAVLAALGASIHFVHASQAPHAVTSAPSAAPKPVPDSISFDANAPQWSSLKVSALAAGALPVAEPVNGRLTYDENRTARVSSPIAGRVTALRAEPGDSVRRGAVLASLDAPDLATAQADWRKAQADEGRKRMAYERAQALFGGEVLARKDYESAQADLAQASAETRRAAQRLSNLNAGPRDDGDFGLRAPIDGVVAERQLNPGQEVRPDLPNPLFVVTDLRHLWLVVDVPERGAGAIAAGQDVALETDAYPGVQFPARVERVGQTLDPITHRIQVRCAVDNADLRLKPEMFARVSFLARDGAHKAVQLPNSSLFVEGRYEYVYVEVHPGTFQKRRVGIALRGHDTSYADAGLTGGERVVTEGAFLLNAEVAAHAQ